MVSLCIMEIKIISNSWDYDFYVNQQLAYRSSKETPSLRYKVSVYAGNDSSPKMVIKQKSSMLSVSFEITRADNTAILFKVVSAIRHHFRCKPGNDTYDIYGHKIETCSVYKNDIQIAWWDLQYSNDAKIVADNNSDQELLIAFYILTNKLIQVRNNGQGIFERMATNISESRPFDANWHPQHEPPPLR